jgi:serine/threonine protein kinase
VCPSLRYGESALDWSHIVQHILEPGTILRKRYEILELVGQGGMGAVYKAGDQRLEGRICAVKEILPALTDSAMSEEELEQLSEQFRTEASILSRLDHPNLPKVSDYFTDNGREYLVMDYVGGRDLHEILLEHQREGRTISEAQVLAWADQLLDALSYLHDQDPPVVHRDIKPSNIKVTSRGTVKLVDFGLVKVIQSDDTRTVTVVQGRGTAAYTPLEQYGGDTGYTDARSDLYSLAATLYHLLTGTPPADAKERFLRPGCLVSLRELNPNISARCEMAIFRGLAMHPSERPANAAAFRALLFGSGTLAEAEAHPASGRIRFAMPDATWREVFGQNIYLIASAFVLLGVAILLSL